MTQTHHEANEVAVSQVLLALYACVFDAERFMEFVDLLDRALTDVPHDHLFLSLERPSEKVLSSLIANERFQARQRIPWVTAETVTQLAAAITEAGMLPLQEDLDHLADQRDVGVGVLRVWEPNEALTWCVVERVDGALQCFRSSTTWEGFLREVFEKQFGLTEAELDVLVRFAEGEGLHGIAAIRKSSYHTVRNQIRSIMEKLAVSSQTELTSAVQKIAGMADVEAPDHSTHPSNGTNLFKLSNGRSLEYNLYNRSCDGTLLYFPCLAGGKHWSDEAIDFCKEQDLRVVSPSRAGFGRSSPLALQGDELLQQHVSDLGELTQALGARSDVIAVSFSSGFAPALRFAMERPERCRKLIAINPIPPISEIKSGADLKGVFKVAYHAFSLAPKSYRALAYLAVRMHRAKRTNKSSPTILPEFDLQKLESPSGFEAFLKNAEDNLYGSPDALWREGTIALSDWMPTSRGDNSLPEIIWVETDDSPFTANGAFEGFRRQVRGKLMKLGPTFPLHIGQLPAAFSRLGD